MADENLHKRCAARHMGPWLIDLEWLTWAVQHIQMGTWKSTAASAEKSKELDYVVTPGGIAYVPIFGAMMKGSSKYGGANTLDIRKGLRHARQNDDVRAVMLHVDSPGGTFAGTPELAEDIRAVGKPVHAYIEDLGASAAFWAASQASRITANATAEVGSLGTVVAIQDTSEKAKADGIKIHVLATGKYKGTGIAPGAPVTDEQIKYLQTRVDDLNAHFLAAVAQGRGVSIETVEDWADGRVWIAEKAHKMGLIDGVGSFEDAMSSLQILAEPQENNRQSTKRNVFTTKIAIQKKILESEM